MSRIAFHGIDPQDTRIWVVSDTGLGASNLGGSVLAQYTSPSWSPTGDRIACSVFPGGPGPFPYSAIWVMNDDGMNKVQLTPAGGVHEAPAWSPDGTRIAYNTAYNIGVVNADGTNYNTGLGRPGRDNTLRDPAWSPDGSKLACTFYRYFDTASWSYGIAVFNAADGSGLRDLSSNPAGVEDKYPAWSPDGTQIAFASNRSGQWNVWIMDADGSGKTNLTHSTSAHTDPTWSPDGTRLAFASNRGGGPWHIYAMEMRSFRFTRIIAQRFPATIRFISTRVGATLMTGFARYTDITPGFSAVSCSSPAWSAT